MHLQFHVVSAIIFGMAQNLCAGFGASPGQRLVGRVSLTGNDSRKAEKVMNMTARHPIKNWISCAAVAGVLLFAGPMTHALENTGFEAPDQGTTGFTYEPAGASWSFSAGSAGLAGPGSVWKCNSTSPDPQGDQFAYLQLEASITQDMSGLTIGATYKLSFYESYRTAMAQGNDLQVILDEGLGTETTIYNNAGVSSTTWVLRETSSFLAEKSSYTLTFRTTNPLTGDRTTIIDGVSLAVVGLAAISYTPISNDADCGITNSRTYTHAIDFQASGTAAAVNGVVFTSMSGSGAGFTRAVANGTVYSHDGSGVVSTTGALADLMQGFLFNGSPNQDGSGLQTYTLSGLTSGITYDLRIYTHAYGSGGSRPNTLVFDVGGAAAGTGEINEDNATSVGMSHQDDSYYINYRFSATGTGIVFTAANATGSDASWHLYGLTCEQAGPAPTSVDLLDSPVGILDDAKLLIPFDEDIFEGSGDITIRRLSDDSLVEAIDVETASVTIDGAEATVYPTTALLTIETDYYVEIDGGAFTNASGVDCYAVTGSSLLPFSTPAAAITVVPISNDTDCDISSGKEYTHTLDFGNLTPGALINDVQFSAYNDAANGSLNFSYAVSSGNPLAYSAGGNNPPNITGNLFDLMKDMYINQTSAAGGTTTWTLSGLEAGILYDTRIYVRQWGVTSGRIATMVFDPDGAGPISDSTGVISEDEATSVGMSTDASAYYISYAFRAVAGEDLVITVTQHAEGASWHLYGISNEVVPPPGTVFIVR